MKVSVAAEGGALRGAFTAGVLDALYGSGLKMVDVATGSSSGIGALAYYAAGNYSAEPWEYMLSSKDFISLGNVVKGKPYVNIDYVVDSLMKSRYPLDAGAVVDSAKSGMELIVPVTDSETGKARYFTNVDGFLGCDVFELMRACMALPLPVITYGKDVKLDGGMYFDGGYSDPLPVDHPKLADTTKIIIVTKKKNYSTASSAVEKRAADVLKRYMKKGTYDAVMRKSEIYREKVKVAEEYARNGDILVRPEVEMERLDNSRQNIHNCVELGRKAVYENIRIRSLVEELKKSDRWEFYSGRCREAQGQSSVQIA